MKTFLLLITWLIMSTFGFSQQYLLEEFFNDTINLPATWTSIDQDGDSYNWRINTWETESYAVSDSWYDDTPLSPENYLVTPQINLTGLSGIVKVRYTIQVANDTYFAEHYKVAVSTTGNQAQDFTNVLFEETLTYDEYYVWKERYVDLSPFIGQNIYITWCHYDCYDQYKLLFDSVQVVYEPNTGLIEKTDIQLLTYPNPANEKLFISGDFTNAKLNIYNAEGCLVYSASNLSKQAFVDVSIYRKGLYLIKLESTSGIVTRKITFSE